MPFITSDFSKAQHNWSEDEISYFREKMEEIGSYSRKELTKKTSYQIYYGILPLLDNLPIHALPLIEGSTLLRARPNLDEKIFSHQEEISYNTKYREKIGPGRFNLPKESMFYAAIQADEYQDSWLKTGAIECYKDLVNSDVLDPNQVFTFGLWQTIKPLYVIILHKG